MKLPMDRLRALAVDVGVVRGGADVGVAEEFAYQSGPGASPPAGVTAPQ
jgi:hypothetical protein